MMALLILGLILWVGAHYFRRFMPDQRAAMGRRGKGIIAVAIVAALVMIIIGYRARFNLQLLLSMTSIYFLSSFCSKG